MHERHPVHAEALPVPAPQAPDIFDARTERQKQALSMLEQGVESVLTTDGFANYLRMLSKFHDYSANNVLMILSQRPDATRVNSYARWQELNRQVMKGEKGIKIFYPIFGTKTEVDPLTGEEHHLSYLRTFGIGSVFDISQTEGEPLPQPPAISEIDTPDERAREVNLRLSRFLIDHGVRMESRQLLGHARGLYFPDREPKTIVIRRDIEINEENLEARLVEPLSIGKTKTLAHEAAHFVADHRGAIPKEDAETVAEASAFVVLTHCGIEVGTHSFVYLAYWGKSKDVLKRNLAEIQKVSSILIRAITDSPSFTHASPRHA